MCDPTPQGTRYFWSGWFTGYSFGILVAVFALLSGVDLLATVRLLGFNVHEGNALANYALMHFGLTGFALYKLALVLVVAFSTWLVDKSNPRLARGVLWGGIIVMGYITILHLAIMIATATRAV